MPSLGPPPVLPLSHGATGQTAVPGFFLLAGNRLGTRFAGLEARIIPKGVSTGIPFMQYVKVAKVGDFEQTHVRSYRLLARPVGVFKEPDGSFYAMEVGCKHENADLTQGRIEGNMVTCPWHGWQYDLKSGECLRGTTARLRRHGLKIEGEDIFVTLRPLPENGPESDGGAW